MLLSPALAGDSKTVVLVTASMQVRNCAATTVLRIKLTSNLIAVWLCSCFVQSQHAVETIQSLRFGEECGRVQTKVTGSVSTLARYSLRNHEQRLERCTLLHSVLARIDEEIEQLQAEIRKKEM
jgi:hypothetical protein